jgi:hypothetical protein
MVFPWRLLNGEPRPESATSPAAASTWSISGNVDVRLDAVLAIGGDEVRPAVPSKAGQADRSREVGRQGGGAGSGTKARKSGRSGGASAADRGAQVRASATKGVLGVRLRIISVWWCVAVAAMVFPWRLLNGEPRP